MKILAVDDDEIILSLLAGTLDAFGHTDYKLAQSGEEALTLIKASETKFDCFLFDIQMPGMDGTELCRSVRCLDGYENTPIIMITAMNNKDYFDRAFLAGATDYVTKPFDITELNTRLSLAERLQNEFTRLGSAQESTASGIEGIQFEEPVRLPKVEGVLPSSVIGNYLSQMVQSNATTLQVFAIRIPELKSVFEGSSVDEFVYVIADIVEVISEIVTGYQGLTSYFGSGIFVCVCPSDDLPHEKEIEKVLKIRMNDPELVYCEDVSVTFSVLVGRPSSTSFFRQNSPFELFGMAIEAVNTDESPTLISKAFQFVKDLETRLSA